MKKKTLRTCLRVFLLCAVFLFLPLPAKVPFAAANPTKISAYMWLELRQLRAALEQQELAWQSWLRQRVPQLVSPGDRRAARAVIAPERAAVRPGDAVEFALTGKGDGNIIGGVNFIICKNELSFPGNDG